MVLGAYGDAPWGTTLVEPKSHWARRYGGHNDNRNLAHSHPTSTPTSTSTSRACCISPSLVFPSFRPFHLCQNFMYKCGQPQKTFWWEENDKDGGISIKIWPPLSRFEIISHDLPVRLPVSFFGCILQIQWSKTQLGAILLPRPRLLFNTGSRSQF